jgi:hypothetical protein
LLEEEEEEEEGLQGVSCLLLGPEVTTIQKKRGYRVCSSGYAATDTS